MTVGFGLANHLLTFNQDAGVTPYAQVGYPAFGDISRSGMSVGSFSPNTGIIGLMINADARTMEFVVQGVSQGVVSIPFSGALYIVASNFDTVEGTVTLNTGGAAFVNTVPDGYTAGLNDAASGNLTFTQTAGPGGTLTFQ